MASFDPEDSHRNRPEGVVALGALVVAGGQAAVLLAATDQPLDLVASSIDRAVEGAGAVLGAQLRDGMADPPAAAVGPMAAARIPLITDHAPRAQARPA